jgi:L-fucose isomerase-like protein
MDEIEIIVRASQLHGREGISRLSRQLIADIEAAGHIKLKEVAFPSGEGIAVILVLTGGVEKDVLKAASQMPSPIILIAHPSHNSLPAALEVLARIRQDGGQGEILFGSSEAIAAGLRKELLINSAWEMLRFSRIGLIGDPSDWLVASDVDRPFLKGQMGVDLVNIPIDELVQEASARKPGRGVVGGIAKRAQSVKEPKKADLSGSVAIYEGLRSIVDKYRLSACSVRCFDLVERLNNTGCYALSRLNDEHVVAGCEGDVQALFSMYLGFLISGGAAFMANVASVDPNEGKLVMAHCSCPLSLSEGFVIRSHFESGIGVGIAAKIPPGPCTVFRLGGDRLNRLFVREGKITGTLAREDLCRTQVVISVDGPLEPLLSSPLGNHHVLIMGHHRDLIERFFDRFLRQ